MNRESSHSVAVFLHRSSSVSVRRSILRSISEYLIGTLSMNFSRICLSISSSGVESRGLRNVSNRSKSFSQGLAKRIPEWGRVWLYFSGLSGDTSNCIQSLVRHQERLWKKQSLRKLLLCSSRSLREPCRCWTLHQNYRSQLLNTPSSQLVQQARLNSLHSNKRYNWQLEYSKNRESRL